MSGIGTSSSLTSYWLLLRGCSEYTEDDIILGIFDNKELVNSSKTLYIQFINEFGDFHLDQGYQQVNLDTDLIIHPIPQDELYIDNNNNNNIYVLLSSCDGFGQVITQPIAFVNNIDKLIEISDQYKKSQEDDSFNDEMLYDKLVLNQLKYENHYLNMELNKDDLNSQYINYFQSVIMRHINSFYRDIKTMAKRIQQRNKIAAEMKLNEQMSMEITLSDITDNKNSKDSKMSTDSDLDSGDDDDNNYEYVTKKNITKRPKYPDNLITTANKIFPYIQNIRNYIQTNRNKYSDLFIFGDSTNELIDSFIKLMKSKLKQLNDEQIWQLLAKMI